MPLLAPTTLTTQGLRRRRAVAISSQQYLAHQKQKHSSHKPSSGALAHSQPKTGQQGGSSVKTCSPSPQQRAAPGLVLKSERRLQMRLDTEEEALEAMDILKDQQDADSSPLSSTPSSLDDAGLPELALGDVAVLKAQRRDADRDYYLILPPKWRVLVLDEEEQDADRQKRAEQHDEDDWELLEDEDISLPSSPVARTFAEVAAR